MFHGFFLIIFFSHSLLLSTSLHRLGPLFLTQNFLFEAKKCRGKVFFLFFISSFPPVNRFESEMKKKWARKQKRSKWGQVRKKREGRRTSAKFHQRAFANECCKSMVEKEKKNATHKERKRWKIKVGEQLNLFSIVDYDLIDGIDCSTFQTFWNIQPSSELKVGRAEVKGKTKQRRAHFFSSFQMDKCSNGNWNVNWFKSTRPVAELKIVHHLKFNSILFLNCISCGSCS